MDKGIQEYLRVIAAHKLIILTPTVLMLVGAWGIAVTTPSRYTATAILALDARRVQIMTHEVVSPLPLESAALRTELDIIASPSLAEQVVDNLGLATDRGTLREVGEDDSIPKRLMGLMHTAILAVVTRFGWPDTAAQRQSAVIPTRADVVAWLLGNLKVSNDGRSFTIVVSFTSSDPKQSARIVNAIADTYLANQVGMKNQATSKANEWLAQRLAIIRRQLQTSEAAVDNYRQATGLIEARGTTIIGERLSQLNAQLANAKVEADRDEAKLDAAEKNPDVVSSPRLQNLRNELVDTQGRIAQAANGLYFTRRLMLPQFKRREAFLERQIGVESKRVIAGLASDLDTARKSERSLAEAVQRLGAQSDLVLRLKQLEREAEANRVIYETFLARYKQTIEQEGLAAPDAELVSPAPIGTPASSAKIPTLLLGGLGGLAIGLSLAFLRENLSQRVTHARIIEERTGVPVLGTLPKVPWWRRREPHEYIEASPHSSFTTALRRLQVVLSLSRLPSNRQVFLVTSAQAGEGKTSFCIALARSLASSDIRTLVIDLDAHRPRIASAFGGCGIPNLGDYAQGRRGLADIVQTDPRTSAHFIAAGGERDFQRLVNSQSFANLIAEARLSYEVIILDTPPVLAMPDAGIIGKAADAALLVVRRGQTSWEMMASAMGFLKLCGIQLDGVVMSHSGAAAYYRYEAPYKKRQPEDLMLLRGSASPN